MTSKQTILVIDDDLSTIELLKAVLRSCGAEFVYTINGQDGLRVTYELKPDLILTDLLLPSPDIKGWDLIAQLKQDVDFRHIPIIAMTAGGGESIGRAMKAGADDFIEKPFAISRLQRLVMRYLNGATK